MADNKAKNSKQKAKEEEDHEESKPDLRIFHPDRYSVKAEEKTTVDPIEVVKLSPEDKHIILETWKEVEVHLDKQGPKVFKRIFEVNPKIQKVFKLDEISPDQLEAHPVLRRHSQQFMEAIQYAVLNMDQLDGSETENDVAKVFYGLGKEHIRFQGLNDSHFGVFTGSILYVLSDTLGERFTHEVRVAWSRLIDNLIKYIQQGWKLETEARK
ncbi:hypothetical protein LSH36_57g05000 [Paralvinella palmiformis]|uniref:Globin domain-containing protein n=1 Tax=Paralvinella palmiformis TaxID=53620 RepID=A0AAD9K5T9_9ANNE|nr:hypothetical protein LSH36_57g05000 [Paralvinella palmiformis]